MYKKARSDKQNDIYWKVFNWESMAGSVIQVTGMVEFDDGLRRNSLLKAAAVGQDQFQYPLGM